MSEQYDRVERMAVHVIQIYCTLMLSQGTHTFILHLYLLVWVCHYLSLITVYNYYLAVTICNTEVNHPPEIIGLLLKGKQSCPWFQGRLLQEFVILILRNKHRLSFFPLFAEKFWVWKHLQSQCLVIIGCHRTLSACFSPRLKRWFNYSRFDCLDWTWVLTPLAVDVIIEIVIRHIAELGAVPVRGVLDLDESVLVHASPPLLQPFKSEQDE